MSAKNPCNKCPDETLSCESLPSALDNFVQHFFGQISKSLVDGKVVWTLPCDLETGIPGYPRAAGEGLACWFKRLAEEALLGQVEANGMVSSVATYFQPEVEATVNVLVDNPPIAVPGSYAWSPDGGWYLVELVAGASLTLRNLFPEPHNAAAGTEILTPTRFLFTGDLSRWDDEIEAAQEAAQAFASAADEALETSLQAYADAAAGNAEGNANAYTDAVAISTLTAANTYADTAAGNAQTAAQTFAQNAADVAQAAAEAYADSVASGVAPEGGNGIVIVGSTVHFAQSTSYQVGLIPFAASADDMGFINALIWDPATESMLFQRLDPGTSSQLIVRSLAGGALSSRVSDGETAEVGLGSDHDGTDYVARSSRASVLRQTTSGFALAYDFGLTPGNTYVPTDRVLFDDDEALKVLDDVEVSGELTVMEDAHLEGNTAINSATFPADLAGGIAWAAGTAPTADVADQVSVWVGDMDAVADRAALKIRGESGGITQIGDGFRATAAGTPDVRSQYIFEGATLGGMFSIQAFGGGSGTTTLGLGAYNDGADWIATAERAVLISKGTGFELLMNSGLTPGNSYSPTSVWSFSPVVRTCRVINGSGALGSNPASGVEWGADSGEWRYRTSGVDEGAGQINRVHNRTEQVNGAGTDYTLTGTLALVDFGTTDPSISLPTAGTYQVKSVFSVQADGAGSGDTIEAKLRNTTDGVDISQVVLNTCHTNSGYIQVTVQAVVTITAAKTVQLWARNATAARGTVVSTTTSISYSRMH